MRPIYLPLLLQISGAWPALGRDSTEATVLTYFSVETRPSLSSGTHYAHLVLPDQLDVISLGQFAVPECGNNSELVLLTTFSASITSDNDVMFFYSSEQDYPPINVGHAKPVAKRDTYLTEENTITAYCDEGTTNTQTTALPSSLTASATVASDTLPQTGDNSATVAGSSPNTENIPYGPTPTSSDLTSGTTTTPPIEPGQITPSDTFTPTTATLPVMTTLSTAISNSGSCVCCSA